jgi:hypothetical protein
MNGDDLEGSSWTFNAAATKLTWSSRSFPTRQPLTFERNRHGQLATARGLDVVSWTPSS